jgi:hypothetical protein
VLRTSGRVGPSQAKHIGVESANGNVIALLDDDDVWRLDKLEKQLTAAPDGDNWIVSCRFRCHAAGRQPVTIPHRLIRPDDRVVTYLFELRSLRRGRPCLAVPTLVFPRAVAQTVPFSVSTGSIEDDPLWLMEVQRALPDLSIIQLPESLVDVYVTPGSISWPGVDRSKDYIEWGVRELADETGRVRGDYLLTAPVASALGVGSLGGVARSLAAGVRSGRPGPWAWGYASLAILRIAWQRVKREAAKLAGGVRR